MEDPECPEQQDVSATPNGPRCIGPTWRSKRRAEKVFMTVNAIKTTSISKDPNFHLKHPGVPDGSDGSDGTSYALTENYMLPVAQATVRLAYVPPLLCGDV